MTRCVVHRRFGAGHRLRCRSCYGVPTYARGRSSQVARNEGTAFAVEHPSAFEFPVLGQGHILLFDVGSTVSKLGPNADEADIAGIALADSDQSINALIPVLLPDGADVFLSDSTAGTAFVIGAEQDVDIFNSRHQVAASTNTPRVVIVKATGGVLGQSNRSAVLCKFIYHSGLIDLS